MLARTSRGSCVVLASSDAWFWLEPRRGHSRRERGTVPRSLTQDRRTGSGFGVEVGDDAIRWPERDPDAFAVPASSLRDKDQKKGDAWRRNRWDDSTRLGQVKGSSGGLRVWRLGPPFVTMGYDYTSFICIDLSHCSGVIVPKAYGTRPIYRTGRLRDVYSAQSLLFPPSDPRSSFLSLDPGTWQLWARHRSGANPVVPVLDRLADS